LRSYLDRPSNERNTVSMTGGPHPEIFTFEIFLIAVVVIEELSGLFPVLVVLVFISVASVVFTTVIVDVIRVIEKVLVHGICS